MHIMQYLSVWFYSPPSIPCPHMVACPGLAGFRAKQYNNPSNRSFSYVSVMFSATSVKCFPLHHVWEEMPAGLRLHPNTEAEKFHTNITFKCSSPLLHFAYYSVMGFYWSIYYGNEDRDCACLDYWPTDVLLPLEDQERCPSFYRD